MIRKEQLLRIHELKLAGILHNMTDSQYAEYVKTLNMFIDKFPHYSESLTKALDTGQYNVLGKGLAELCDILAKLHADTMAAECQRQSRLLMGAGKAGVDQDALEAFIEDLIQSVSALSIEVQMAVHKSAGVPQQVHPVRTTFSRPSILAVDNAVMFLHTLKKLLSEAPYELHCATSGAEALEFLGHSRPDAILLDIEMPEMDGYELARKIKRSGYRGPIIFITANSAREYVDRAVEVGAVGLLMKPLRINQLLTKLKEVM